MKKQTPVRVSRKHDKLALFFPGIGYHTDKPLLYYSRKLAMAGGYDTVDVQYSGFAPNVKGSETKMQQAFLMALEQADQILRNVPFQEYEELLFVSKSIGTAVACSYQRRYSLKARNIYYTPVPETFSCIVTDGIVFHGTADPWADTALIRERCREEGLPLYITENANHSLETGDVETDLRNLAVIMKQTEEYIRA